MSNEINRFPDKVIQGGSLRIPILVGSFMDLSLFDFSFKGIQIQDVKSKEFAEYLEYLEDEKWKWNYYEMFKETVLNKIEEHERFYAIIKSNPFKNFDYQDIASVYRLLLIIFPSDLQIQYMLEFNGLDLGMSVTSWNRVYKGDYPGNMLYLPNPPVSDINEFINRVFDSMNRTNTVAYIIENYVTSYEASHAHFQYLNLCICLESIVHGDGELTYRMRRSVAILCGENPFCSQLIFDNIRKIYDLRSKIIHGEKYEDDKVEEYLPFLISIVSRTIMELLIHGITDIQKLNEKITTLGFGDREKISQQYKQFDLNIFTMSKSNWIELRK